MALTGTHAEGSIGTSAWVPGKRTRLRAEVGQAVRGR